MPKSCKIITTFLSNCLINSNIKVIFQDRLTIELSSQIFERVERYAKENGLDFAGILIDALDNFLRRTG